MRLKIDEKVTKQVIEKKLKKKYKTVLKSSRKLNLMFEATFRLINKHEFKAINEFKIKDKILNGKEEVKIILFLLKDSLSLKYSGIDMQSLLLLGLGIFYLVEPFDIINDFLPIIGFVDDFTVLSKIFEICFEEIQKYKEYRNSNNESEIFSYELMNINSEVLKYVNDIKFEKGFTYNLSKVENNLSNEIINSIQNINEKDYINIDKNIIDINTEALEENKEYFKIKTEDFFQYSHKDYCKLIYQQLLDADEDIVTVTTEMIKRQLIDKKYFDYNICVETMINNQTFDELEKKYKLTKPYNKIIDSDKKQSITGSYYVVTYQKNESILDYFESDYDWVLETSKNIDANNKLIKYKTSTEEEFNKNQIESIVNHVINYYEIIDGIYSYKIEMENKFIEIKIDNRNKPKIKVIASDNLIKEYIDIFDYLEEILVNVIKNRINNNLNKDEQNLIKYLKR